MYERYLNLQQVLDKEGLQNRHLSGTPGHMDFWDHAITLLNDDNWIPTTEVLKDLHSEFAEERSSAAALLCELVRMV